MTEWLIIIVILFILIVLASLRIVNEYERGVKFSLGKFSGIMNPGLNIVIPILQTYQKVDMRVRVVDVPKQDSITKDNITVSLDAVIYYRVVDSKLAIIKVEHYDYAMSQLAQTTMRNIVGEVELDELLGQREKIAKKIRQIVDASSIAWGINVEGVELKDISLAQEIKRVIAKQAEAERERRATIIKAEGEVAAAKNMASAAKTLSDSNGAMHLRTLQTISDVSSEQNNTIIFALPIELMRAMEGFAKKGDKKK